MLRAEAALSHSIELDELNTLMQSKEAGIVAPGWGVLEESCVPPSGSALVTHRLDWLFLKFPAQGSVTASDPILSFEIFSASNRSMYLTKPDSLSSVCKFGGVFESVLLPLCTSLSHDQSSPLSQFFVGATLSIGCSASVSVIVVLLSTITSLASVDLKRGK